MVSLLHKQRVLDCSLVFFASGLIGVAQLAPDDEVDALLVLAVPQVSLQHSLN